MTQSDTTSYIVDNEKIQRLETWLSNTAHMAGLHEPKPANEETAYYLGAHHMAEDTIGLIKLDPTTDSSKSHKTRNVVAVSLLAGTALGVFIGSGEATFQLEKLKAKAKRRWASFRENNFGVGA